MQRRLAFALLVQRFQKTMLVKYKMLFLRLARARYGAFNSDVAT